MSIDQILILVGGVLLGMGIMIAIGIVILSNVIDSVTKNIIKGIWR